MIYQRKTKPALWTQVPGKAPLSKTERWKRIRGVAKCKAGPNREYAFAAKAFIHAERKAGKICPVVEAIPELHDGRKYGWPTSNKLNEVHHIRGKLGSLLMDKRCWMAVSRAGHRWIHAHITEARERGWICQPGEWNTAP